jgi:hypothetical protein
VKALSPGNFLSSLFLEKNFCTVSFLQEKSSQRRGARKEVIKEKRTDLR